METIVGQTSLFLSETHNESVVSEDGSHTSDGLELEGAGIGVDQDGLGHDGVGGMGQLQQPVGRSGVRTDDVGLGQWLAGCGQESGGLLDGGGGNVGAVGAPGGVVFHVDQQVDGDDLAGNATG